MHLSSDPTFKPAHSWTPHLGGASVVGVEIFLSGPCSLWPLRGNLLPSPASETLPLGHKLSGWCLTGRTGAIGQRWTKYLYPSLGLYVSEIWWSYYNNSSSCIILGGDKTRWHFGETHLPAEWWIISDIGCCQPTPLPWLQAKEEVCAIRLGDQILWRRLKRKNALLF